MKTKGKFLLVSLLVIVLMSSCATPVAVSTPTPIDTPTSTPTPTMTPTSSPTTTPTVTATPEPVLYCTDKIPGCYFLGSEIARIFARMTVACFENGGECYPPVEECTVLPPRVVHVPVEDFAAAWEAEVNGNSAYKDLLDSRLYDTTKQYCFVDEGIAQSVQDAGNVEYKANKACLDNEKVPCDVALLFFFDPVACGIDCLGFLPGAFLTENRFLLFAVWTDKPLPEIVLESALKGESTSDSYSLVFAYVFLSSAAGFNSNNENPPSDIYIGTYGE